MAEQASESLPIPLLIPALLWSAGIIFACLIPIPFILLTGLSIGAILLAFILKFRLPAVLILVLLAGMLRLSLAPEKRLSPFAGYIESRQSITQSMTGRIIRLIGRNHDAYLTELTSVRQLKIREKVILRCKHPMLPGDTFQAVARLEYVKSDPILDNVYSRLYQSKFQIPLQILTVYEIKSYPATRAFDFERIRYLFLEKIDRKLGTASGFGKALLLGDRSEDKQWIEQLIRGGLLHLIAISGLHVIFFYFIFVTLFQLVLPRRSSELLFIVLMLGYAALCQWSAPVMRAIIMILLYVLAKWLQRPVAPLQIISLSLIIITLFDPLQLFSIGLQLSYACILILIFVAPHRKAPLRRQSGIRLLMGKALFYLYETILISVLLGVLLLPLTMFHFQRGSLNGIIGNLPGIPFVALLLPLTVLLLVIPANWLLFAWFKTSFDALHHWFEQWVNTTAGLPFYLDATGISLSWLATLYLLLTAAVLFFRKSQVNRLFSCICAGTAVLITGLSFLPAHQSFRLICFNAGMGDCSLAQFPNGQTLMVDTGPRSFLDNPGMYSGWFGFKAGKWFRHNNINTIDLLVLTHLHDDHSGGLPDVLEQLKVRNIIINHQIAQTSEWKKLLSSGLFREAKISVLADTLTIPFAGSRLAFLHPSKGFNNPDENLASSVLRLDYHGFSALFSADITAEVEALLVSQIPDKLDCDWLKAPHHGSRLSNSADFIRAVSPRQVVMTAARRNRFSFPHKEAVQRYHDYGVEPVITGNGSVLITIK